MRGKRARAIATSGMPCGILSPEGHSRPLFKKKIQLFLIKKRTSSPYGKKVQTEIYSVSPCQRTGPCFSPYSSLHSCSGQALAFQLLKSLYNRQFSKWLVLWFLWFQVNLQFLSFHYHPSHNKTYTVRLKIQLDICMYVSVFFFNAWGFLFYFITCC